MRRHVFLIVLSFLCLQSIVAQQDVSLEHTALRRKRTPCDPQCRFFLTSQLTGQEARRALYIVASGDPTGNTVITLPREDIRYILKTGEALVSVGKELVPISEWRPAGLKTDFSKKFFGAAVNRAQQKSSIGKRPTKSNQNSFLTDRCIVLPIRRYELITKSGEIEKVNTNKPEDCVTFELRTLEFVIDFNWDSGDDMDVALELPSGEVIDRLNPRVGEGRLNRDNNQGVCGQRPSGRERISYDIGATVPRGKFTATAKMAVNCDKTETTDYRFYVVFQGKIIKSIQKTTNVKNQKTIAQIVFTID